LLDFIMPTRVRINSIVRTHEESSNKPSAKPVRKMFSFNFELLPSYRLAPRVFLSCIPYWFSGRKANTISSTNSVCVNHL
jgi:hypothetical protein